jgi:hypothetical protein
MKKIILFILIFITLYGCNNSGYEPIYNPYQGSDGLTINFLDNAPPNLVYELETFPLGFVIKNNGAYDIQKGIINLNYERDYIKTYLFDETSIMLKGKHRYNPNGEEKVRLFYFETKKMDSMSQIRDSLIGITACYEYYTELKTEICIDPDTFNINKDKNKPCTVSDKTFNSQGAPVGIMNINPTLNKLPNNDEKIIPEFEIVVKNINYGNVISKESIYRYCSNEAITREDFGKIEINAKLAGNNLNCEPKIIVLEDNKIGKTRCKLEEGIIGTSTSYNSLLEIFLKYGYTTSISKEFKIYRT